MLQVTLIISIAFGIVVHSAPPLPLLPQLTAPTTAATQTTISGFEPISLEGLDYILKRAEKLFRISDYNEQQQYPKPEPYLRLNERLQPPNDEPYNFYLPVYTTDHNNDGSGEKMDIKSKNLLKFSPPDKSYEHNYYASKPKKIPKKYSASIKQVNLNTNTNNNNQKIQNEWEAIFNNNNNNNYDNFNTKTNDEQHKIIFDDSYFGIDAHIPIPDVSPQVQENQHTSVKSNFDNDDELADDREEGEKELPIVYRREHEQPMDHEHSFVGPKSYKFGYNTGKGKNRQFRFEERNAEGNVKGQYGYTDKFGKTQIVKYLSSADKGFQIVH